MKRAPIAIAALAAAFLVWAHAAGSAERVRIEGELVDTWCYVTELMFAEGTAHHQCAVWCAVGGIPVSVRAGDGQVYMVLRLEGGDPIDNPTIIRIQSHQVTVEGDLYRRDGVNYLIVTEVADDKGIVNMTHGKHGIQPFGK